MKLNKGIKISTSAFTLIECLIALLVISGATLTIEGLTKLLQQEYKQEQVSRIRDWQVFSTQLRSELDGSSLVRIEQNFLYIRKWENPMTWRFGLVGTDFRKSNSDGRGYQPLLFGIEGCQISRMSPETVRIDLRLGKGGDKTFLYTFPSG